MDMDFGSITSYFSVERDFKEKNQIAIALLVYQFASNPYLRIIRKVSKRELPKGAMYVFKCKVCKSLETVLCIYVHFA